MHPLPVPRRRRDRGPCRRPCREGKRCCAFFQFTITVTGGEVLWDCTVLNDDARPLLEDYYSLPDIVALGVDVVRDRVLSHGLTLAYDI